MSEEKRPMADEIEGEKLPYPAKQSEMKQQPDSDLSNYKPAGKLKDKVAIITGADSGIGRAVAIAFAMEGARVAIVYNENDDDANETKRLCERKGGECLVIKSDVPSVARTRNTLILPKPLSQQTVPSPPVSPASDTACKEPCPTLICRLPFSLVRKCQPKARHNFRFSIEAYQLSKQTRAGLNPRSKAASSIS